MGKKKKKWFGKGDGGWRHPLTWLGAYCVLLITRANKPITENIRLDNVFVIRWKCAEMRKEVLKRWLFGNRKWNKMHSLKYFLCMNTVWTGIMGCRRGIFTCNGRARANKLLIILVSVYYNLLLSAIRTSVSWTGKMGQETPAVRRSDRLVYGIWKTEQIIWTLHHSWSLNN